MGSLARIPKNLVRIQKKFNLVWKICQYVINFKENIICCDIDSENLGSILKLSLWLRFVYAQAATSKSGEENEQKAVRENVTYLVDFEYRNQEKIDLVSRAIVRTGAMGACLVTS